MTNKETTPLSSEQNDFATELVTRVEHFRLPGGLYATELMAALNTLSEANAELRQLRDIPDEQLTVEQKTVKDWAVETIGQCNQTVLEYAEKYPHLFK